MTDYVTVSALWSLLTVIAINVALSGDNAVVVGMAAAGLPAPMRKKAIAIGIGAATLLRVVFAVFTVQLLEVVGLLMVGGLLLLWVSWKLWKETQEARAKLAAESADLPAEEALGELPAKTYRQAVTQIVIADVSMSLDNVLAVAGAAHENMGVLVTGLALSVLLMGVAANVVANLLQRFHWIAYIGLAIIVYVALEMIYQGSIEVMAATRQAGMIDWSWLGLGR